MSESLENRAVAPFGLIPAAAAAAEVLGGTVGFNTSPGDPEIDTESPRRDQYHCLLFRWFFESSSIFVVVVQSQEDESREVW